MASQINFYDIFYTSQWVGLNLMEYPVRVRLLTSAYEFDPTHTTRATVTALGGGCELPTAGGYTVGGQEIGNKTVNMQASPRRTRLIGDNVLWEDLTATFRWALYHLDGTHLGHTDLVLCAVLLDDTPADIVASGVDYLLLHSANGIFTSGDCA